jgi:hypothetical protein
MSSLNKPTNQQLGAGEKTDEPHFQTLFVDG